MHIKYNNFNSDANSERVMRWIIAKSVMYFIRHECPQNCNTIITDLINLKSNGVNTYISKITIPKQLFSFIKLRQ